MRNRPIPQIAEDQKAFVRSMIIYEDQFLLAFDKPSGLAVQTRGNRGTSLDHLLWTFARSNGKTTAAGAPHRCGNVWPDPCG